MFPQTEAFFSLCELEQALLKLGKSANEEAKHIFGNVKASQARECGRAAGFFSAAHMVSEMINRMKF